MELEFKGTLWHWKGPAPWYFVTVPPEECQMLREQSGIVSYGWGMIPVDAGIGGSNWPTSLFPQDESYVVPVKAAVRKAEGLAEGDLTTVRLSIRS